MKPVTVEVVVARPPREVFEFLDALANHERFLDHYLVDWTFSGPKRGVGAKARARVDAPGSQDHFEFEVTESEAPKRIVEQGVSSGGKRRTRGTYSLEPAPDGGTRIEFELAFLQLPRSERLIPPLTRAFAKRVNAKAMRHLAKQLDG
ncbi:MAG TPA: SRPBCC family protein [Solirubrobacterales bacterium]|nr:SRPBCC family protein [Solirubrobacterales bacterium]